MSTRIYGRFLLLVSLLSAQAAHGSDAQDCSSIVAPITLDRPLDEAHKLGEQGHYADARAIIKPLVEQYPHTFRVLHVDAIVEAGAANFAEAELRIRAAISLQAACIHTPNFFPDYTVFNTLGWIEMAQGRGVEAEQDYQTAILHAPDLTPASVARTKANLGYLYYSRGDFEKARPLLMEAKANGNEYAANVFGQLTQAEQIYQEKRKYFVVALTSDSKVDLDKAVEKVRLRLGPQEFSQTFPDVKIYRPSDAYQFTLLLNGAPLSPLTAKQLKAAAVSAGFSKDTWLMPADDEYFLALQAPTR